MKIASFNVQRFGLAKVSNSDVLSVLVKVTSDFTHGLVILSGGGNIVF